MRRRKIISLILMVVLSVCSIGCNSDIREPEDDYVADALYSKLLEDEVIYATKTEKGYVVFPELKRILNDDILPQTEENEIVKITADVTILSGGIAGYNDDYNIEELKECVTVDQIELVESGVLPSIYQGYGNFQKNSFYGSVETVVADGQTKKDYYLLVTSDDDMTVYRNNEYFDTYASNGWLYCDDTKISSEKSLDDFFDYLYDMYNVRVEFDEEETDYETGRLHFKINNIMPITYRFGNTYELERINDNGSRSVFENGQLVCEEKELSPEGKYTVQPGEAVDVDMLLTHDCSEIKGYEFDWYLELEFEEDYEEYTTVATCNFYIQP